MKNKLIAFIYVTILESILNLWKELECLIKYMILFLKSCKPSDMFFHIFSLHKPWNINVLNIFDYSNTIWFGIWTYLSKTSNMAQVNYWMIGWK